MVLALVVLPVACFANSSLLQGGNYGVAFAPSYGQPAISRTTGKMYALLDRPWYDQGYDLYESSNTFGLIWKKVRGIGPSLSYNGFHQGHDILISADSRLLFTRRNTVGDDGPHVLLSDVIDISVSPPKVLVQGPMCCMDGEETLEGVERNHQRILPIARAAGLKSHSIEYSL